MKKVALSALLSLAMVGAAAAQSGSTSPSSSTPDQNASGSNTAAGASATGTTQDQTAATSTTDKKMEKEAKLTGCIEKQGSNYALVDKKHPNGVQLLSSEDLSAHVGHKVQVKGTWEAGSASSASSTSPSGSTSASSSAPSSSTSSTSASNPSSTSGAGSSSNASTLPQSDQAASGQALRVSEIKMKSDKCENPSGASNPSKY